VFVNPARIDGPVAHTFSPPGPDAALIQCWGPARPGVGLLGPPCAPCAPFHWAPCDLARLEGSRDR